MIVPIQLDLALLELKERLLLGFQRLRTIRARRLSFSCSTSSRYVRSASPSNFTVTSKT